MFKNLFLLFFVIVSSVSAFTQDVKTPAAVYFEVPKMMCGACTSRVKKAIESHVGTSDVRVTLEDHSAKFACDAKAGCDLEKIKKDLARIQYPAKEIK